MVYSPNRDRESSFYRSRSSSISTPTSTRFLYQEVYAVGENALVRSYSCGQILTKTKDGQTYQSMQVQISNFISPVKKISSIKAEDKQKPWTVPKRLRIEYHQERKPVKAKMALTFTDTNGENKSTQNSSELCSGMVRKLMWKILKSVHLTVILLTVLSASFLLKYMDCNQHWDTQEIARKLQQSVFGQDSAIHKISTVLETFSNSDGNAMMVFTGGSGVGKTFVSSIIFDNFPWSSNENVFFYDSGIEESLITKSFSNCGSNLIIIDGMNVSSTQATLRIVHQMIYSLPNYKKLLVILIFQIHDEKEEGFIIQSINNLSLECHHVPFRNLKKQDIRQCFYTEMRRQKKYIPEEHLNNLVMENMKTCNVSKSYPGCKNVVHVVSGFPGIT